MSRTVWLALFCLIGLGPAIAIKVATPPASLVVQPAQGQSKIEPALAPNQSAKSDRLELPDTRGETELTEPSTTTMPVATSSTSPETVKQVASRHWQDANARTSVASPRRHTKSKESKRSAGKFHPNERAEVWHCRQDGVGSLLRSLDLSPRCNL
jgi:hypothetical protein